MADFAVAYDRLRRFEGGWANDPADRGGETYAGISRKWWPDWAGWRIVDAAKKHSSFAQSAKVFSAHLRQIPGLRECVRDWYRHVWWDALGLDVYDQELGNELFEQAVNLGDGQMCEHVQRCCNALNWESDGTIAGRPIFKDLVVDGSFGPKTRAALRAVTARNSGLLIVRMLNALQAGNYIAYADDVFDQRRFLRGWLKRTIVLAKEKI